MRLRNQLTYVGCRQRGVECDPCYVSPRVKAPIGSLFPCSTEIAAVIAVTLACLLGASDPAGASPPAPTFRMIEAPLVSPAQALAQAEASSAKSARTQPSAAS